MGRRLYFEGLIIELSSDVEWNIYLGPPGVSFPTFTPQSKKLLSFFTLQQETNNFIVFRANKYVRLKETKPFEFKEYCQEGSVFDEYIKCEKQCFLTNSNVR